MHFAQPEYLHFLWMIPFLGIFFYWALRRRRRRLESFISRNLVERLTEGFSQRKAAAHPVLLMGFFLFGILALSQPQWGMRLDTVQRRGVDVVAALDTSYSMSAEDVAPNRLAKAKSEIRGLIERLKGDRISLIAFAGSAVIQCPLTLDYGAAMLFLDVANTEIVPDPGTSLAAAIETATSAFIAKEKKYKVLIVFTDGEDLQGQVEDAIRKARDGGVVIYTVGIGSPEGKPIPVRDLTGDIIEYRKDPEGQIVVSRLDERALTEIAAETGGRYFRASTLENELDEMYEEISRMEKKQLESRLYRNFEDRFQYPLGLALLCLVMDACLGERRRPGHGWLARIYSRTRRAPGDV
jgi:Ca-activated chloride channel family protein